MTRIEVETALGPIWLHGSDRGLPLLVLITGLFADEAVWRPTGLLAHLDYVKANLPGNHCPPIRGTSLSALAAAFDEALRRRFPDRPTVLVGFSVGALVTLAMRVPQVRARILVEPPLRTAALWPVQGWGKAALDPYTRDLVHETLGVTRAGIDPRDYTSLFAGLTTPIEVVFGTDPLLPERAVDRLPSFVDEETRQLLRADPRVKTLVAPDCGHNVPAELGLSLWRHVLAAAERALLPAGEAPESSRQA